MKLIICGNGFDKHHRLNTSYSDYRNYLHKSNPTVVEEYEEFCKFFNRTSGDCWSDIESSLTIDADYAVEKLSDSYVERIQNSPKTDYISLQTDCKYMLEFINLFTGTDFVCWLKQIDFKEARADKTLPITDDNIYINFNYTNTLENIYNIPAEKILHIHGNINSIDCRSFISNRYPSFNTIEEADIAPNIDANGINNFEVKKEIQFGSPITDIDKIKNQLKQKIYFDGEDKPDFIINEFEKIIKNIESNFPKLEDFLKGKLIDEIVILGHSINGNDKKYYEEILLPKYRDIKWTLYFYNRKSLKAGYNFAKKYELKNFSFVFWKTMKKTEEDLK